MLIKFSCTEKLLNQTRASLQPVHAWFLEITSVRNVCMRACVCVCPRPVAINN